MQIKDVSLRMQKEIVSLIKKGLTKRQTSELYGMSTDLVDRILIENNHPELAKPSKLNRYKRTQKHQAYNLPSKFPPDEWIKENAHDIYKDYEVVGSLALVARKWHITIWAIYYALCASGHAELLPKSVQKSSRRFIPQTSTVSDCPPENKGRVLDTLLNDNVSVMKIIENRPVPVFDYGAFLNQIYDLIASNKKYKETIEVNQVEITALKDKITNFDELMKMADEEIEKYKNEINRYRLESGKRTSMVIELQEALAKRD